jgi:hypothetical protein
MVAVKYIVMWCLKAGIVEPERTYIAEQRFGKLRLKTGIVKPKRCYGIYTRFPQQRISTQYRELLAMVISIRSPEVIKGGHARTLGEFGERFVRQTSFSEVAVWAAIRRSSSVTVEEKTLVVQ